MGVGTISEERVMPSTIVRGLAAFAAAALLALVAGVWAAESQQGQIDFNRARELIEKQRGGGQLTPDEREYVQRARAAREAMMKGQAAGQPAKPTGLIPLDQLPAAEKHKGEDGGLYGGGKNEPPPEIRKAAARELARIVPLDAQGSPSPDGKIVLISMGMSNTTQEFSKFKELADADTARSPRLVIVDCAQGGRDAARWSDPADPTWKTAEDRLAAAGVTPRQVQAAWVKHARIGPARYGEFPRHAEELQGHITKSLQIAREKFPNLRLAYLSSRIYAGYASTQLNPEPYAYESAFAVRGLIQAQAKGDPKLNCDPARGDVKAPLLLWGPYLWADGTTPRKSDGLVWTREDLAGDGTHPSPASGREKVARLLLEFLKTNANAKGWFLKAPA
jgi:hypothetical protein